jgi:DNA repair protein RecN (Recombination protein N)
VLEELHVTGLGVIDEASLELSPGLNVLTGETGAGKTLVTLALGLVLGGRGGADLVRPGRDRLAVEARFSVPEPPPDHLAEWAEEGELFLGRGIRSDGRGTARAGGHLTPASTLASVGTGLVEVHGQRQTDRLLAAEAQTSFLDRFAGPAHLEILDRHREVFARMRAARSRLDRLEHEARERERERDLLAYQLREIESAALRPGEPGDLEAEESRLAHAERIIDLAAGAQSALADDGAAVDRLREAAVALRNVATLDAAAAHVGARAEALAAEADDLAAEVRDYRETVALDPARLDEVRERAQAIRSLERKYGDGVEGILAFLGEAGARLEALTAEETERGALEEQVARLTAEVEALTHEVTAARREAAPRLAAAVTAELLELGMQGAEVSIELPPLAESGPGGAEAAEFRFSGGPKQPVRPLSKVASGGELSRVMLACRSVVAELDDVPTLVFDEVDAGVGGRAAAAVGRRLAILAASRQVVVVTHLAQIAAHADRHFVVVKEAGAATVERLHDEARPAELARMLSGDVTDVSLAHARDLIETGRPG